MNIDPSSRNDPIFNTITQNTYETNSTSSSYRFLSLTGAASDTANKVLWRTANLILLSL